MIKNYFLSTSSCQREGSAIKPLPWVTLIIIAVGAAKGLSFLHRLGRQIICRDFKPPNILLDSAFTYNTRVTITKHLQDLVLGCQERVETKDKSCDNTGYWELWLCSTRVYSYRSFKCEERYLRL